MAPDDFLKPPPTDTTDIVRIPAGLVRLEGSLNIPKDSKGIIAFAHGAGSSRMSPRNLQVAQTLADAKLATLLFDLLTPKEDEQYENRFDISALTERLINAIVWLSGNPDTRDYPIGIFGASTGAAAAVNAAAALGREVKAVVSRGGRPDLAADQLRFVSAPTMFIVGGDDTDVLALNQLAYAQLTCKKKLEIIPGATHLFEETGALEKVSDLARSWFLEHLAGEKAP